jgi:hypothetical protein
MLRHASMRENGRKPIEASGLGVFLALRGAGLKIERTLKTSGILSRMLRVERIISSSLWSSISGLSFKRQGDES